MKIRDIDEVYFDDRTSTLKITGRNPFKKEKSVRLAIDDTEKFLNAIKLALSSDAGNVVKFHDDGRVDSLAH